MRVLRRYRRLGLCAAFAAGVLGVGVALADTPTYPECTKKASKEDTEAAKNAHRVAAQFYERADYDKALQYWSDSYRFDCSANDLLLNIANAYEKKGDRAATIVTIETYLKRTGPNPTLEEKVRNLKALLNATASASASASAPPPAPTAAPTAVPTVVPPLPPPSAPPPNDGPRPYGAKPWFLVGGGGAIAIVGAILLPIGLGNISSAENACPNRNCTGPSAQSNADQGNTGRTEAAAGGALLGIGLAAAVGGLVWQFAGNKPGPSGPPPSSAPGTGKLDLWLTPMAGRGTSGLAAGGSF